jgi:hypothetical protein
MPTSLLALFTAYQSFYPSSFPSGDGICCRYGEGYFRVSLDGDPVLFGGSFNENVTEILNVGYDPTGVMTQREKDSLESHSRNRNNLRN